MSIEKNMDTKNIQLDDSQRTQLDGIVQKMIENKESDSNIQFVVNDFKDKYGTKPPGFFQGLVQSISNPFLKLTSTARAIGGVAQAQTQQEQEQAITKPYDYGYFGKVTPIQNPLEAIGTGANIGLTIGTGGTGSVAKSAGLTGAKALGARVLESAVIGGGYQASSNLANSKPVTDNLTSSTILGGVVPVVGTGLSNIRKTFAPTAETLINSLIKPLGKDFAYNKNPAKGLLNEGIIANNFEDLANKVIAKTESVGRDIGSVSNILEKSGIVSDLTPALKPIDEAINKAAKSNNSALFESLNKVKVALLNDLKAGVDSKGNPMIVKGEAKNLISASYNDAKQFLSDISTHTRFTGNPSDDKALNMATKKSYGIVREIMNNTADKVSPEIGATVRNLNERYSNLLSAQSAISHRDLVLKRQNFLNLADRFSIPVAVAGAVTTGLVTGDFSKAGAVLLAELGTIGATKALSSTYSKTRIAQFLSRLAPEERAGILNSTPVLKNWYERITGQTAPVEKPTKVNSQTGSITPKTLLAGSALGTAPLIAKAINKIPGEAVSYTAPELPIQKEQKGIIDGFDISKWATDPNHEIKVKNIYKNIPDTRDSQSLDMYIKSKFPKSPITGDMVYSASEKYNVPVKLIVAIMQQDSGLGTTGLGSRTFNPGNVANNDSKNIQKYKTWNEGVNAVAKWLSILNKK